MKDSASPSGKSLHSSPMPAARVPLRTLVLISALYWVYVTLSNVLYAHGMQVNATRVANVVLFAPWNVRVLQHLLLFPVLLGCFWASLRAGWLPLRGVPVQVALGLGFASLSFVTMDLANDLLRRSHLLSAEYAAMISLHNEAYGALWTASLANFSLTYSFGVVLITGFAMYQRYRDSELRVTALEKGWNTARLAALRMQLSPHTLFNLLHIIRGQITQEPQIARSMVMQLADLLRQLLNAGQREFSLLGEELGFVRLYLELQQQRFPDRLSVVLPDAEAQPAVWIPSLILQPLVENAVIHGLAGHDGPVNVRIEVLASSERLNLRVVNTVAAHGAASRGGIGLNNVRERLAVQFGQEASLSVGSVDATTYAAQIEMPALRELSAQSAAPLSPSS